MKQIAVTGGAGFVGSNLVKSLVQNNFEVLVIDNFSTGLISNLNKVDCEIIELDICNFDELRRYLKNSEYIFHLGARGSVPRSIAFPQETSNVNIQGTLNVLEIARMTGASVAFSSSSSVYGANDALPKSEDMWTAPLTPYAASKLSGEALVMSYASSYGISAITYRFFNIFGPWQRPNHDYAAVIPKWIWKALHREPLEVYGDGTQSRDFTYIDTVIEILIQGMKKEIQHPRPVNLAFGLPVTINECIELFRQKTQNLKVKYLPSRFGDIENSHNNPTMIKKLFPNIQPIDFSSGLDRTFEWFETNKEIYEDLSNELA